jgi:hypothetical protein
MPLTRTSVDHATPAYGTANQKTNALPRRFGQRAPSPRRSGYPALGRAGGWIDDVHDASKDGGNSSRRQTTEILIGTPAVIHQAARRGPRNSPQQPVNNSAARAIRIVNTSRAWIMVTVMNTHRPATNPRSNHWMVCRRTSRGADALWSATNTQDADRLARLTIRTSPDQSQRVARVLNPQPRSSP